MSYYIIAAVNHHQLTDLIYFHNYNARLRLANQKPNTNSITSQVEFLQCRNSKSFRQKLRFFNVNISASTQFMNLRLGDFVCIVLLYALAKF